MKNFKRVIAILTFVFMLAALVGCGGISKKKTETKSDNKIVLGFSQLGSESDWRLANTNSIKEAAQKEGIELKFENAEADQQRQIEAIRGFIRDKVDVIAFAPVVETGWEAVLNEAKAANIPVIITDRNITPDNPDLYVTFMGSDFTEEGKKAALWLNDYLTKKGNTGEVKIIQIEGTAGSGAAVGRTNGFAEVMKNYPNWKMVKSEPCDFTRQNGKEVMASILQTTKDFNVLVSQNDDMALGAIEAMEAAGMAPGKDVIIISYDGTKEAFRAMVNGKINCIVECNPLLGPQLMMAVKDLMAGKTLPKRIVTEEGVFPQETAAQELPNRKF